MMFAKRTEVNRFLAKERFYAHNAVSGAVKQALIDQVEKITIANKLSPETMNIEPGKEFNEIIVLKILLKCDKINPKLLDALDKSIRSGYVLFILEYNGQQHASISYKCPSANSKGDTVINSRWFTEWQPEIDLQADGMGIDTIYAGLINQISGGRVATDCGISLQAAIDKDAQVRKLEKQIQDLREKIRKEPQLKRQIEFSNQVRQLEKEVKELKND